MKTKNIQHWILAALFITVASCKPEIDAPKATAGSADFSRYIAVGNSLTAGYADGGLYLEGQKVAYPNIIAAQLKSVGGGTFNSPFFTEAQANGSGYIRLSGFNPDGTPITANVTDKLAYRTQTLLTKYTEEIQNLGIPGMRLDLGASPAATSFSGANMFFERLLAENQVGATTYLTFVQNRNHTFFSFWLGNNDVLGWATNGGDAGSDPTKQLTSVSNFTGAYNAFITALTANGAKGVVATIPDVTSVPFFNTVTVAAINQAIDNNSQVQENPLTKGAKLQIRALNPQTGLYITRQATKDDLIPLTFNRTSIGATVNGIPGYGLLEINPIAHGQVLDAAEIAIAKQRVIEFNNIIKQAASSKNLALVDTYTILNGIRTPANYDGILVSSAFITGNAFSLDGIHLTPIGNAVIANQFIKAINEKYNSNIPTVAVSSYNGVKFP